MRFVKMLGLLIAAVSAIAAIGVGSASATVLCEQTPEVGEVVVCPAGMDVAVNGVITAQSVNLAFTNSVDRVNCEKSTISLRVTKTGGTAQTVQGEVTALTFGGCKTQVSGKSCTVEAQGLPFLQEIHWVEAFNGLINIGRHSGGPEPGAKVVCGAIINCTFRTEPVLTVTGGNPISITANGIALLNREGTGCPATASLDATFNGTGATSAIWVAKE